MEIVEEVNAAKATISGDEVWEVVADAEKVIVTSGKKILEFEPGKEAKEQIVAKISGRTGNLRAPTLRIGNTYYVGFNETLYQEIREMG